MSKKTNRVRGKIPGLIKIFSSQLETTIQILLPEGGRIVYHKDGTWYRTRDFKHRTTD